MTCTAHRWTLEPKPCPHGDGVNEPIPDPPSVSSMRGFFNRPEHRERCIKVDGRWVYVASVARDECTKRASHDDWHIVWGEDAYAESGWSDDSHGAVPHQAYCTACKGRGKNSPTGTCSRCGGTGHEPERPEGPT